MVDMFQSGLTTEVVLLRVINDSPILSDRGCVYLSMNENDFGTSINQFSILFLFCTCGGVMVVLELSKLIW